MPPANTIFNSTQSKLEKPLRNRSSLKNSMLEQALRDSFCDESTLVDEMSAITFDKKSSVRLFAEYVFNQKMKQAKRAARRKKTQTIRDSIEGLPMISSPRDLHL